ncbi:hypothetical protein PILCRDRAFT_820328 [Piloderma croceum F 1598]|uniref:L-type lectin-like domain-containing protein n=1 Tax=Piloderma croceum (strain F 1598) TaxID=765440 RepID=A0A0C3FRT6_PILCF|nr:hypothetical protein PILCRDRAFT_820328 [Piloderma croceum F 1598]
MSTCQCPKLLLHLVIFIGLLCLHAEAASDSHKLLNRTIERQVPLRTHSIYAPYIDQDLQNRWWDFGADSYINTNKHIRLTRPRPSQMGWLWSRLPLTAASFIVEVEFKISGESSHLYGDGLAFWVTKGRAEPGPVFGNIDKFEGLGIFLDTYANSRHSYAFPRITGMLGDGTKEYDQVNDGEANSIGACSANYRKTNVATKLKITYVKDTSLNVQVHHKAWDEWTDCFTVQGISLPPAPYLGFSAMTGDVSDAHDIITVNTYSAILSPVDYPRDKLRSINPFSSSSSSSSGSWLGFFFKLFLFAGVCVGAFYGYQIYLERNGRATYGGAFGGPGGRYGGGLNHYVERFTGNSKRF